MFILVNLPKSKRINLLIVMLFVLFSSGCVSSFDPAKALSSDEGIALARVHLSGEVPKVTFVTYNKNKILDPHGFRGEGASTLAPITMPAGEHSFDKAVYMQGIELIEPDISCVGEFNVEAGKITYVGDIYFHTGDYDNYVVFSSYPYKITLRDNMDSTMKALFRQYPSLKGKYDIGKSLAGPFICQDEQRESKAQLPQVN
ncbi:hypothetical protein ISG33_08085 [Glaciecola sp. MH2013]|uniref:hypothetical protein n=1 Tax=Glaciecola sp. MH2013 TaxID=2785524 RepID=UPI0018A004D3|nr:hypothetical protein [Glaciecola sp. MH2013]MBF7073352.1 hypothetical protein [Glaciecola sp. MH2013]